VSPKLVNHRYTFAQAVGRFSATSDAVSPCLITGYCIANNTLRRSVLLAEDLEGHRAIPKAASVLHYYPDQLAINSESRTSAALALCVS